MPEISVILPVYNTLETFLREAVESILNQSFSDFELIIINDGSSNNAEDVIKSYADKRIIYIRNEENLGIIKALNNALKIAKGKYIARMDSDDVSYTERFALQHKFMEENPDYGVCGSNILITQSGSCKVSEYYSEHEKIKYAMLFFGSHLCHPTVFIRKSILDKYKFFYNEKDTFAEDYGLWLNLLDKVKFYNLKEILLRYRVHEKNISVVYKDIQDEMRIRLMMKFQKNYLGLQTDNLEIPLLKVLRHKQLTSYELNLLLDYYIDFFKIKELFKEKIYTKNQVLGLCKKAIFNTKPDLKFFFVILKPKLIKNIILRYLNLL